jgi:DNA-binding transcriptional LysR family regulator
MKDLIGMAIFARVAEVRSFSLAARRLNLSKSVVSKHVSKLEKSLGARLLNRTTRSLSLTEIGAAFYEHCARIVEEAEKAELVVGNFGSAPRGVIKVNASVEFGTVHVAPALPVFLAKYPEVSIDMTLSDRFVDLAEEGYDVAIRTAWRDELGPNLVARELAPIQRKACATPDYFERHGIPDVPSDLINHNCLIYTRGGSDGQWWRFMGPAGEISVPVSGNLRLNDNEALWRAVLGGVGVALLPTFLIGEDLQRGALQATLTDYTALERSVYAVYLPSRNLSPKVRAFIDFLIARFGPEPYWDQHPS